MPHLKCVACRTRLSSTASSDVQVGDLCPGCGSLLEPVGELAEVVGFRAIKPRTVEADSGAPGTHQRIAGRVLDLMARREATHAEAPLDAERWLDDGGSFSPEATAEEAALPAPREHP
jgi:Zn-finger nucleic acid-binding protein